MQKRKQKSKNLFETIYNNTLKRKKLSQGDVRYKGRPKQIVFVGAPQVGKTQLIITFIKNEFNITQPIDEQDEISPSQNSVKKSQSVSPNPKPNVDSDTLSVISELSYNPMSEGTFSPKLDLKNIPENQEGLKELKNRLEELETLNQKRFLEIQEYKRIVQELEQKNKDLAQMYKESRQENFEIMKENSNLKLQIKHMQWVQSQIIRLIKMQVPSQSQGDAYQAIEKELELKELENAMSDNPKPNDAIYQQLYEKNVLEKLTTPKTKTPKDTFSDLASLKSELSEIAKVQSVDTDTVVSISSPDLRAGETSVDLESNNGDREDEISETQSVLSLSRSESMDTIYRFNSSNNLIVENMDKLKSDGRITPMMTPRQFESPAQTPRLSNASVQDISNHTLKSGEKQQEKQDSEKTSDTDLMEKLKQVFSEFMTLPIQGKYVKGINLFNEDPVKGIKFLILVGFINDNPESISKFLFSVPELSKRQLGIYLGSKENEAVLRAYCDILVKNIFKGVGFDRALRMFFNFFKLPPEGQQITRIAEEFSMSYSRAHPEEIKNPKTATLLACALLMLNTDLHNPKVKQKMTKQQFFGIFKNAQDPPSKTYLGNLYDSIKKQELRLSGSDMFYSHDVVPSAVRRKKLITRESITALLDATYTYSHVTLMRNQRVHFLFRDTKLASDIEKSLLECAKHADFYIVTFSLLDEKTFDFAKLIINHIIHIAKDFSYSGKKIYEDIRKKILLVGTKCDDVKNRAISHTKATQVSLEFGITYMECSAVENKNVKEVFWRAFEDLNPSDEKKDPTIDVETPRRKPSVYI